MKFLMLIKHAESVRNEEIPQGLMDAMGAFVTEGFKDGWLKDTAGLQETKAGVRIRSRGNKLTTTDGPFTEAKEVIGGFAIVETKTRAEGMEKARQFMELHRVHWPAFDGECEVRPFEEQ